MIYRQSFIIIFAVLLAGTSVANAESRPFVPSSTTTVVPAIAQPERNVRTPLEAEVKSDISPVSPGGSVVFKNTPFISQSASILMGLILALNSGFINGCALSGAIAANGKAQAVAAVTASWTNSAMGLASGDKSKFGFLGKVLLSFISGSLVAGYLQPKPQAFLISSSSFGLPLVIASSAMILAKSCFDDASSVKLGFYALALANGINNSVTSTMTSNLCRTSHFTGISSDIGTFLGQILRGNKTNLFKLKVFAGLAACFWSGGFFSYGLSKEYGSRILYVPALVYFFMGIAYDKAARILFQV